MYGTQMELHFAGKSPFSIECDALICFVFSDSPHAPSGLTRMDAYLKSTLKACAKAGETKASLCEKTVVHAMDKAFRRLVVMGLGPKDECTIHGLRLSLAEALRYCRAINCAHVAVAPPLPWNGTGDALIGRAVGETVPQCLYRFEKYLHAPLHNRMGLVTLVVSRKRRPMRAAAEEGLLLGRAVCYARTICNEPANVMTPTRLSQRASGLAERNGLDCTILDPAALEKEKMGLILAVGQGSREESRLIVLEYNPPAKYGKVPTVALVGKGITYDSGGISLKQRKDTMFGMKRDLTGGAIVLGLMRVIAGVEPPMRVIAAIPSAENMPGAAAIKPGDVVQSASGKYIEILNTDAEGRLVMADAFTYVQRHYNPGILIDIATIGGAPNVFGPDIIPVFSSDDALYDMIEQAASKTGENVWRMPLHRPYRKGIRSYFSDLKNMSLTQPRLIKSALFLESFVDPSIAWTHLDVGGGQHFVSNKEQGIYGRGATAKGMMLLAYLLEKLAKIRRRK